MKKVISLWDQKELGNFMDILDELQQKFDLYFKREVLGQEDKCFYCAGDHLSILCDNLKAQNEYWIITVNKKNENVTN